MDQGPSLVLVVPGRLSTCSGGYEYDRRIVAGLRGRGWAVDVEELGGSFPVPSQETRARVSRVLAAIPTGALVLVDGLALGALPLEAAREAGRLRLVALVHHPLAEETGLDTYTANQLAESERRALSVVHSVVVTSQATAANLANYDVHPERIAVVEPGTDPAPLARGSDGRRVHFVCVAAIIPRKGHEVLMRALAIVPERNWRLTCVGDVERDPAGVDRLRAHVRADGLADRVVFAGEGDRHAVAAYYDEADLLVMPSLHEGYGMAVAEALARGLPVVGTNTGAIPELLNGMLKIDGELFRDDRLVELSAGLLVQPDDADSLAAALSLVLRDVPLRERLTQGARRVRDMLPTWEEASEKMAQALMRAAGRR
jgi:glycosyltransferase involved in cell wall biosynthesis